MLEVSPLSGIEILIDMSLITIYSVDNSIKMHDMLQEVGRAIEVGTKELGKRKRLWNNKDSYQILHNESEASIAEVMYLDMSKIQELQLSPTAFKNMQKLRLVKLYVSLEVHKECKRLKTENFKGMQPSSLSWFPLNHMLKAFQCFLAKSRIMGSFRLLNSYHKVSSYDYEIFQKYCKLYFPKGLESLPHELMYLYWDGFPFKSLPSKCFPENLVEIHMPNSQVKQLWSRDQNLRSLKHLNLRESEQLAEVPDLSGSPNIESIDLSDCTRLVEVPLYFQNLENLTYLNLEGCYDLKILRGLPCNIEVLHLSYSKIKQIHPSTWSCEKLHTLDLRFCYELESLNTSQLNMYGGDKELLSKSISSESCKLKRWPSLSSVVGLSLRNLDLRWCKLVSEIPNSLICIPTLEDIDLTGTMIESIPTSIKNVSGLQSLKVSICRKLRSIPELPSQLHRLDVSDCTSLKNVESSRSALMRPYWTQYKLPSGYDKENFTFSGCYDLDESSRNNIICDAQLRIMRLASTENVESLEVNYPGNEIPRWFEYKSEGCEMNIKFSHHENLEGCEEYPKHLGFALAVVVEDTGFPSGSILHSQLLCDCNFKTSDGRGYQCDFYLGSVFSIDRSFKEDHVVVVFLPRQMFRIDDIPFNKVTESSFRFYAKKEVYMPTQKVVVVKKCGVHLLHDDFLDT